MTIQLKVKAGVGMVMDAGDNPTFEQWMSRIDRTLLKYRGVSVYDLPDCLYHDWYDERLRPVRAANKALAEGR